MSSTSRSFSASSAIVRVIVSDPSTSAKSRTRRSSRPGDTRRAAGAPGDLVRAVGPDADAEHAGAAPHDELQFGHGVELEADRDPEPVAQRRREQAGSGGGADEGELRQVDFDRARRRPLPDDEIELEILHGGIEDLLDGRVQAMDFVDEEHVALFEPGQLRREIAGLGDDGAGGRAEIHAEFARDDLGERRLAEAGRTRRAARDRAPRRVCARPR